MRYELVGGGSAKFWEIELKGKAFQVTWGRLGTDGQTQSKSFDTAAEARAAHDKLVAEKLKKGYRAAKQAAKAAKSAKAKRGADVASIAALIEAYGKDIASVPELDVRPEVLKASSAAALAALERELKFTLPADLRMFLARGLRSVAGGLHEPFAHIGFDFLDAKGIVKHTTMLRRSSRTIQGMTPTQPSFVAEWL